MDFAVLSNDETMLDILAYESASFIESVSGDLFQDDVNSEIALEAEFYQNPKGTSDNGGRTYFAQIGKKSFSGSIDNDSSMKKKFLFHVKSVALRCLTGIIKAFEHIGEVLRKVLQTILIPLNAVIKAVRGTPSTKVALFTKEEETLFTRLRREAETKVANVAHHGIHDISEMIDKAFDLADRSEKFVSEAFSKGVEYDMRGLATKEYQAIHDKYSALKDDFNDMKEDYNKKLSEMRDNKAKIEDGALGIKNGYYRKVLYTYMTINPRECEFAIGKSKNLAYKSTSLTNLCKRLQTTVSASNKDVSNTVHTYAGEYMHIATLCNEMVMYLNTFLSAFNITTKVKSTGVSSGN